MDKLHFRISDYIELIKSKFFKLQNLEDREIQM